MCVRLVLVPGYHSFLKWAIAGDMDWWTWVVKVISGNSYVVGEILSRKSSIRGLCKGSPQSTISNEIVETPWGNFNPQSFPVPSFQSWGVCCLLRVAWTAAQHCMEGMGRESFIFPFWSWQNIWSPLGQGVLATWNFVAGFWLSIVLMW